MRILLLPVSLSFQKLLTFGFENVDVVFFFCSQFAVQLLLRAGRQGIGVREKPVPCAALHRNCLVVNLQDVAFSTSEINPVENKSEDDFFVFLRQLTQVVAEMEMVLLLKLVEMILIFCF